MAASLLEEALHLGAAKKLTTGQLDGTLKELAQFSVKIPLLPDEAVLNLPEPHAKLREAVRRQRPALG